MELFPVGAEDEERLLRRLHAEARERQLARHLALVGFMGAGKSSLGRIIAGELGRPFVDTDDAVEERGGRTIESWFAAGEEPTFRALEAATIRELLDQPPMVLALGGGALQDPVTRALLFDRCFVVHLFVSWAQVRAALPALAAGRPLLRDRPEGDIHELYIRRQATYRNAHLRIDAPRGRPDAAAADVLSRLFPD